jgi:hypothetical protein
MTGGPTSAMPGSPLGRRSFIPGTPRFVRFISLFCGPGRIRAARPAKLQAAPSRRRRGCQQAVVQERGNPHLGRSVLRTLPSVNHQKPTIETGE